MKRTLLLSALLAAGCASAGGQIAEGPSADLNDAEARLCADESDFPMDFALTEDEFTYDNAMRALDGLDQDVGSALFEIHRTATMEPEKAASWNSPGIA